MCAKMKILHFSKSARLVGVCFERPDRLCQDHVNSPKTRSGGQFLLGLKQVRTPFVHGCHRSKPCSTEPKLPVLHRSYDKSKGESYRCHLFLPTIIDKRAG